MYYRRKLIVGMLEHFGRRLNHTRFQKILFLVTREQVKKSFDFVPYKYGCFSFQANQDLLALEKENLIQSIPTEKSSYCALVDGNSNCLYKLKKEDQSAIRMVRKNTAGMAQRELIRHTYLKYPFYAIKSRIVKDILSKDEISLIHKQQENAEAQEFFTIGYEGISLEAYLKKLIVNDIKLLCDVRKNALSRKYGFSKSQLKNARERIDIEYIHIPNLGIDSDKRQELNTMSDYRKLFEEYEQTTLKKNQETLKYLFQLVKDDRRVAITCFEKKVCMCHRRKVLKASSALPNWSVPIKTCKWNAKKS